MFYHAKNKIRFTVNKILRNVVNYMKSDVLL